jgi:hypothetical protein
VVPPLLLLESRSAPLASRDVLGCLSLPTDVLAEAVPLPPLYPGDVLAFPNAGAYGLWASPMHFHGHTAPAEVVFDGAQLELIRARAPVQSILEGQSCLSEIFPRQGVQLPGSHDPLMARCDTLRD